MGTYVILRRGGRRSPADLEEAAARSTKVGDEEMSDDIRWIRGYVLDEILKVADRVFVRPDPEAATA